MTELENEDLYELLDININSSTSEIKKAYRKKALECHPDKNPDNPNAAIEFHKLSKVLEILIDESARTAYNRVLKARQEAKLRHQELDGKRRKFKEDLEAREKEAATKYGSKNKSDEQKLKEEIERLRKEGSRQVEAEVDYIMKKVKEERENQANCDSGKYRIKIKWKALKNDGTNGGYSNELLQKFLSKYGDVTALIMSPKKMGSALVEFSSSRAAEMAVDLEKGLSANPLQLQWVTPPPLSRNNYHSSNIKESDFESVVLTKMRQAEERRKLIEQMMKEDADET